MAGTRWWGADLNPNPNPLFYSHFYWKPERLACVGESEVADVCPPSQESPVNHGEQAELPAALLSWKPEGSRPAPGTLSFPRAQST